MKTLKFILIFSLVFSAFLLVSCEASYVDVPATDEILDGTVDGLSTEESARFLKGE
uniref:colicin release lysis protein n=1 Tax=Flavobacterium sp. TaxID=239 RepID=UPI0026307A73